jgi:hypothetical protein
MAPPICQHVPFAQSASPYYWRLVCLHRVVADDEPPSRQVRCVTSLRLLLSHDHRHLGDPGYAGVALAFRFFDYFVTY